MVLQLDGALPSGTQCEIRVVVVHPDRSRGISQDVLIPAEAVLAIFQSMNVRVSFKIKSLSSGAAALLGASANDT